MTNSGAPLPDRLRQIADDLYGRTASTHSDACWQWHDTCALHRAAEQLDRLTVLGAVGDAARSGGAT